MEFSKGMVVKSISGHDSGSFYVIMFLQDGFAYIADGRRRKAEKPKKKNLKHLGVTKCFADTLNVTNKQLRKYLRNFNFGENIDEESEQLV